jgi:hypothetical protein
MILKSRLFLVLAIAICLTGCKTVSNSNGYETSVEIEPMPSDNKLNEYTALYTDVDYKYGKDVYGQSIRIDIKKDDFANIPNSDFVEFVRISSKMNDNIVIAFEDNTAIIFTNTYVYGKYGILDLDLGITEIIGEYSLDENNHYIYKELSKQE